MEFAGIRHGTERVKEKEGLTGQSQTSTHLRTQNVVRTQNIQKSIFGPPFFLHLDQNLSIHLNQIQFFVPVTTPFVMVVTTFVMVVTTLSPVRMGRGARPPYPFRDSRHLLGFFPIYIYINICIYIYISIYVFETHTYNTAHTHTTLQPLNPQPRGAEKGRQ